ncbi:MAG TPA: C39 family peptidase, partial [Candidatus Methylomirabilis sp.]
MRILNVPYVPQSEALCGGAALAMVLRYGGAPDVLAEDFEALVEPEQGGIPAGALVSAVENYGWTALPLWGTPVDIEHHLGQGRPVIALIRTGSGSFHYVVLVAWANGWVILHDPKLGPFRAVREAEFNAAWSGSGGWALLVLPSLETGSPSPAVPPPSADPRDECGILVEAGVLLAQDGDTAEAERRFLQAETSCPQSPAPVRERAGLRFLSGDWPGAIRLAEQALALDPNDAHTWQLLAGSFFLEGDVEGALRAWNHVSEPRTDLTHIDGLSRIRYSTIAGQLDLPPRRVLTPRAFRQARRRLAEVPAQADSRLSLRPGPGGMAQVDVALQERPSTFGGPWDLGSAGVRALSDHELTLEAASPTGNGELWTAAWRWWENRPRVSLALAIPGVGGRPGIWRVEGLWERQTYAYRDAPVAGGAAGMKEEERRRTAICFSDWLGPDFHVEIGAALDAWGDRGSHVSLEGSLETRWARDHLALGGRVARWLSLARGAPFGVSGVWLRWSS